MFCSLIAIRNFYLCLTCFLVVFYGTKSEKPVIIKRPTSQNVYINQSAIFVCHVRSSTAFVIGWIKDNQQLQNVSSSLQVLNDSLSIAHARRRDGGTYTCRASNAAGVSSAQATLRVLGEFFCNM